MSGLAEEEIQCSPWSRRLRLAGGVVLAAAVVGVVVLMFSGLGASSKPPARQVTRITVMPDTPPPPPPPPKEEPRREPPKESPKEVKLDPPKQDPAPAPQAEQLKMEGAAGEGASPFAAGTVLNEYRGGELGGGGLAFTFYTSQLQRHLQGQLARMQAVKRYDYRVMVRVWLAPDGSLARVELDSGSGDAKVDEALRVALGSLPPMSTRPPADLPQPIKVRITNRVTG